MSDDTETHRLAKEMGEKFGWSNWRDYIPYAAMVVCSDWRDELVRRARETGYAQGFAAHKATTLPTVLTHYVVDPSADVKRSLCGKFWKSNDFTVSEGRCPTCEELVESGWAK